MKKTYDSYYWELKADYGYDTDRIYDSRYHEINSLLLDAKDDVNFIFSVYGVKNGIITLIKDYNTQNSAVSRVNSLNREKESLMVCGNCKHYNKLGACGQLNSILQKVYKITDKDVVFVNEETSCNQFTSKTK